MICFKFLLDMPVLPDSKFVKRNLMFVTNYLCLTGNTGYGCILMLHI